MTPAFDAIGKLQNCRSDTSVLGCQMKSALRELIHVRKCSEKFSGLSRRFDRRRWDSRTCTGRYASRFRLFNQLWTSWRVCLHLAPYFMNSMAVSSFPTSSPAITWCMFVILRSRVLARNCTYKTWTSTISRWAPLEKICYGFQGVQYDELPSENA